jgi:hypothetical protein
LAFISGPSGAAVTVVKAVDEYAHGMAALDAIRFRQQARNALYQAEAATNSIDIKAWLLIAEDWLKLAEAVEARQENVACAKSLTN